MATDSELPAAELQAARAAIELAMTRLTRVKQSGTGDHKGRPFSVHLGTDVYALARSLVAKDYLKPQEPPNS